MGPEQTQETDADLFVTGETEPELTPHLVIAARSLKDDTAVLEAIASGLTSSRDERRISPTDAICAVVAERLLHMRRRQPHGEKPGVETVVSTAHLIQRNLRAVQRSETDGRGAAGLTERDRLDGTLFALYEKYLAGTDPIERMSLAFQLGDRAVHFSGGWVGSQHLVKSMNPSDRYEYGRRMASCGYEGAEAIATRHPHVSHAKLIMDSVPGIRRYFGSIVQVIASLTENDVEMAKGALS